VFNKLSATGFLLVLFGKIIGEKESKIMIDQVKSFDKWRLRKLIGKLPEELMIKVEKKLKEFLLLN
jgi:mRNA-degrading endonuclease toxin of MazEF toxin-antitoxin module